MNIVRLPAGMADGIEFHWLGGARGRLVEMVRPAGFNATDLIVQRVLPSFFAVGYWDEVTELTQGIQLRRTYGTDMRAVAFLDGDRPGNDGVPQVGVRIEDGSDNEVVMPMRDFIPLAARWLGALRDGALANDDPATRAGWWPEWAANVAALEHSAAA